MAINDVSSKVTQYIVQDTDSNSPPQEDLLDTLLQLLGFSTDDSEEIIYEQSHVVGSRLPYEGEDFFGKLQEDYPGVVSDIDGDGQLEIHDRDLDDIIQEDKASGRYRFSRAHFPLATYFEDSKVSSDLVETQKEKRLQDIPKQLHKGIEEFDFAAISRGFAKLFPDTSLDDPNFGRTLSNLLAANMVHAGRGIVTHADMPQGPDLMAPSGFSVNAFNQLRGNCVAFAQLAEKIVSGREDLGSEYVTMSHRDQTEGSIYSAMGVPATRNHPSQILDQQKWTPNQTFKPENRTEEPPEAPPAGHVVLLIYDKKQPKEQPRELDNNSSYLFSDKREQSTYLIVDNDVTFTFKAESLEDARAWLRRYYSKKKFKDLEFYPSKEDLFAAYREEAQSLVK